MSKSKYPALQRMKDAESAKKRRQASLEFQMAATKRTQDRRKRAAIKRNWDASRKLSNKYRRM